MFSFRPALAYDPIGRAAEVVSPYLPSLVGQLGMLGNQEMLHRIDLLGVGTPSETTPFDRLDQGRAAPMDAVTPSSSPVVVADGGMVVQKSFGGREIAAKVANGEVTVRGGVGGKNGRGGLAVSTDGVVTADGRVGGEAAGVEASLMVDVDANGIGSWSARGGVAAGPGSVHVGGGEVGGREVQALPNGKFKATVYAAKGASFGAKLGANDVENEGQASVGGASMVEAEFDTAAEAEAFAATQDPVRATWAANELQHLGPGERMRRELSVDVSQKASVSDGLKAAVGIEAGGQSSLELERRDDGRLRVTRANEASVGGSCGMGVLGLLGLDEELGVGFQNSESVDFDLEQAGALAAFETYQLTGELPDPLPAGVTLAGSRCTTSWRDQLKTTLPSGTHEVERVLEEGTEVDENGRGAGIMNATVRDAQTWGGPLTGELDRADATTVARLRTPDDECGGETLTVSTTFSGRGAAARAADLATPGLTASGARTVHGDGPGTFTVDTDLQTAEIDDLGWQMAAVRAGESASIQDEIDESAWGQRDHWMKRFTDGEGDLGALVRFMLAGGSAAHEHVVNNDKGVTAVTRPDATTMRDADAMRSVFDNADALLKDARAGYGDEAEILRAIEEETTFRSALPAGGRGMDPASVQQARASRDNTARLHAALEETRR